MNSLEVFNDDVFAEDYIPPIEEEVVGPNCFAADLNFDPFHHEQSVDYAMTIFEIFNEECHESEFVDQLVEEQVVVPIFMFDYIAEFFYLPKYDEHDDDYDIDFLEHHVACSPLGNDYVQRSGENIQPTYSSYENDEEYERSIEFVE
jgi:hypothetical protein